MIYGWAKLLNTTPGYVLYEMSYENLLMYGYAAPSYDDEEAEEWDDRLDANNPDNFNDNADEEEEFI